jgi:hypothetical protein
MTIKELKKHVLAETSKLKLVRNIKTIFGMGIKDSKDLIDKISWWEDLVDEDTGDVVRIIRIDFNKLIKFIREEGKLSKLRCKNVEYKK